MSTIRLFTRSGHETELTGVTIVSVDGMSWNDILNKLEAAPQNAEPVEILTNRVESIELAISHLAENQEKLSHMVHLLCNTVKDLSSPVPETTNLNPLGDEE